MGQNEIPQGPRYQGLPSGAYKMISEAMVRSAQIGTYLALTLTLSPNGTK
jgi:hypothetical protein